MSGFFLQGSILLKYHSINKVYYYANCIPPGEEQNTERNLRKIYLLPVNTISSITSQQLKVLTKVVNPIRVFHDEG